MLDITNNNSGGPGQTITNNNSVGLLSASPSRAMETSTHYSPSPEQHAEAAPTCLAKLFTAWS